MSLRRQFILLIGAVGCALALVFLSAPTPKLDPLGPIESAALPYSLSDEANLANAKPRPATKWP